MFQNKKLKSNAISAIPEVAEVVFKKRFAHLFMLHADEGYNYEHLAKEFKRRVLTHVGRDSSEMAVCQRSFFVR